MDRMTFVQNVLEKRKIPVEIIARLRWFVFHTRIDQELFHKLFANF